MKKGNSNILFVITLVLFITLSINLSSAFYLNINNSNTKVNPGENTYITTSLTIETNEIVPVDEFILELFGPIDTTCTFLTNTTAISGCENLKIQQLTSTTTTTANLSGNYSGQEYTWPYNLGYEPGKLSYNITINTSTFPKGIYESRFRVKMTPYTPTESSNQNITVFTPVAITNLPQTPLCAYEKQDILVSANVTGSIKQVLVEVLSSGKYTNKTATYANNVYSTTINSTGGQNISWRFIGKDIANDLTYSSFQSTYIVKKTNLTISPLTPNGLSNWYITMPIFTLKNTDASSLFYRWDGAQDFNYTTPFNLTNIPNSPPETAGILQLNYWSNTLCGEEQKQTILIYVDLTSPILTSQSPQNNITRTNPQISVILDDIYGSNSGINKTSVIMKLDNVTVNRTLFEISSIKLKVSFNSSNLTQGKHTIQISGKDKAGNTFTGSWSFYINSSATLALIINSPQNTMYSTRQILFNLTTENPSKLEYIDNNNLPRVICSSCNKFSRKLSFNDGFHELRIKATDTNGNIEEQLINLSIDSQNPRITSIKPITNQVTNGSLFYIKYTETNLKLIKLLYGNKTLNMSCSSGNNQECQTSLNLSEFNNQYLDFIFIISDYVRDITSKTTRIKIDTTAPTLIINYPKTNSTYSQNILFNISLGEKSKLEYMDNSAKYPRFISLCTTCSNYKNLRRFSIGNHNLIIRATDKAGNQISDNIIFTVV